MKWYQDDKGNVSILRIMSVPVLITGIIVELSGVVAMFLDKQATSTALTVGVGIIAATMGAKAWQKISETR